MAGQYVYASNEEDTRSSKTTRTQTNETAAKHTHI